MHVPGNPVILYNIWDVGSAHAVVRAGAKALATGSHPVADANGWSDGQEVPIDFALANAKRIADSIELPLTVDFEGAYSDDPDQGGDNVVRLAATGAVGCNFEDQVIGGEGLHPWTCRRSASRRSAAPSAISSSSTPAPTCTSRRRRMTRRWSTKRSSAGRPSPTPAPAGSSSPASPIRAQVERIVKEVPLPLNLISFPGAPPKADWANAGVARISHGPHPHRALMAKFEEMAREAIG